MLSTLLHQYTGILMLGKELFRGEVALTHPNSSMEKVIFDLGFSLPFVVASILRFQREPCTPIILCSLVGFD
jgi:hypothetical protein